MDADGCFTGLSNWFGPKSNNVSERPHKINIKTKLTKNNTKLKDKAATVRGGSNDETDPK